MATLRWRRRPADEARPLWPVLAADSETIKVFATCDGALSDLFAQLDARSDGDDSPTKRFDRTYGPPRRSTKLSCNRLTFQSQPPSTRSPERHSRVRL